MIFSISYNYCLSVNTSFEANKLPKAGIFGFQNRYAGIDMVLLHV